MSTNPLRRELKGYIGDDPPPSYIGEKVEVAFEIIRCLAPVFPNSSFTLSANKGSCSVLAPLDVSLDPIRSVLHLVKVTVHNTHRTIEVL